MRTKSSTLNSPVREGGLAAVDFIKYYKSSLLQRAYTWLLLYKKFTWIRLETDSLPPGIIFRRQETARYKLFDHPLAQNVLNTWVLEVSRQEHNMSRGLMTSIINNKEFQPGLIDQSYSALATNGDLRIVDIVRKKLSEEGMINVWM